MSNNDLKTITVEVYADSVEEKRLVKLTNRAEFKNKDVDITRRPYWCDTTLCVYKVTFPTEQEATNYRMKVLKMFDRGITSGVSVH